MAQRPGSQPRFTSWWRSVALRCLLGCLLLWAASASASEDLVGRLKVAYLYNFTSFVHWPEHESDRPFVIGVIGDPQMVRHLQVLEQEGRHVEGRPIEIRSYDSAAGLEKSEVLFVGQAAEQELDAIVNRTLGEPTLLVGDTAGYAGRGVAIEFFLKPGLFRDRQRLRFRIDPKALHGRGLKVSSQLMDVAEVLP